METQPDARPTGADETPTVAEPAAGARLIPDPRPSEAPTASSASSHLTSVFTPRETLHLQEIGRTRVFVTVCVGFALLALGTLPLVGGDPAAKRVFAVALGIIGASCGWLAWQLRQDQAYTVGRATVVAYLAILGGFAGIWFFGVFSPAAMVLPFGISFFSVGQSARAAAAVYLTCAALELSLMVLVLTGVLPDQGLVRGGGQPPADLCVIALLVQATLFATFLVQRRTRATTLHAIEEHDRALRSLAQRDALLLEARQDLALAQQVGGAGRWTEQTLGSFRLGAVLGRGAMGEVYEATHASTGEPAAVKLLHPHVLAQADMVQRFVREARIVAALSEPHVVRVLEVSGPDAPVPYLAMERLFGMDLADYLREHKRLGMKQVVAMLRQVGQGIDAAHAAGVVHRDLKPRNLFLVGKEESWKILDFGVARRAGEETLTVDQIVGTPNYMAPEQAEGAAVTPRSDLYALGVLSYRALTGCPAFEGQTTAEILYKVVHEAPRRPGDLIPLPAEVELVLAVAIAKEPRDRFESGAELARAFEAAAGGSLDGALRARAERVLRLLPWAGA